MSSRPKWGGAPTEKCTKCGKTVYAAEMAKMENQIWHIECLRCVEAGCNKKLSGSNWGGFVAPNNSPYCSVHLKRLVQSAGSSLETTGSTTGSKWNAQGSSNAEGAEKKAVPADQACTKCGGRSYPAESVKMEGQLWHENCLRCVETGCGKKLNGSNWGGFVAPNNSPYCSVHLKRLVQSAGSSLETTGSTTGSKWNSSNSQGGAGGAAATESSSDSSNNAQSSEGGDEEGGNESSDSSSAAPSGGSSISSSSGGGSGTSSPAAGGAKPKWGGAPSEKCIKCGKTVYSAEMVKMENQIFHDNCLRCVEEGCNKKLNGSNWGGFVPPDNKPYCKIHHQRLLQSKGSSIEFSGSTATSSKWKINSGQ